jgi:HPt (histidine-containing phosphotransfer) domain-containing protein
MDDFVTKPLRPETLAWVLDRWVGATSTSSTSSAAAGDDADPLDRGKLDELGAMGPGLVRGVVTTFLDTLPERLAELRAAVARQDTEAVRALAHGVRGSAGYVGAVALADALALLENGDAARTAEHFAAVETELARVAAALRNVLTG